MGPRPILQLGASARLLIVSQAPGRAAHRSGIPFQDPSGARLRHWLDLDEATAGFGDPTVLFIASLFVVSEGIDASGVTTWAGQELIARAGASRTRLVTLTMLLVALLTGGRLRRGEARERLRHALA